MDVQRENRITHKIQYNTRRIIYSNYVCVCVYVVEK
jgi:hypothetical protein